MNRVPGDFRSFVILAGMRTGSNHLEASLNSLPGVASHGELFNPLFIGRKDRTEAFGCDLAARDADPLGFLDRVRAESGGLPGFRFFHDHDHRVLDAVLADRSCAKIVLTRNPAESYVSLKIAQETGQWRLSNARNLKQARIRFDAAEFQRHLEEGQDFRQRILAGLQTSGQAGFFLDYEDILSVDVLNGLAGWLGAEGRIEAPADTLKRQNPGDAADKVENIAEMEAVLARMDLFGLSRSAFSEPRQAPAVPGYVAAGGTGLLYLPLNGGPERAVTDWLARLGGGRVEGNFTQKTLKQWRQSHLPHRAFTVVRHPVLRAWAIYHGEVLANGLPDLKRAVARMLAQGKDGAEPGPVSARDGFLAFLRFAKRNIAGQTALRTMPHCASQTALIQAFGQVQPPDAILREDRLAEGLAWIAGETGVPPVAYEAPDDPADALLREIYDAEVERAARDAWGRDYLGFGFGPWAQPYSAS